MKANYLRLRASLVAIILLGFSDGTRAEHPNTYHVKPQADAALADYMPAVRVSGHLTIAGSDTMQPILTKLAMAFRRWHPQTKIAVQGSRNHGEKTVVPLIEALLNGQANSRRGDGKTSGHLGSNQVQLLALARELTRGEILDFVGRYGYRPTAIPIAQDAVAVYVNGRNPIRGLTLDQVDAIFSKTRKRGAPEEVVTWGQAGLREAWQNAPIRLYGRNKQSISTRFFFRLHALLDGEFMDGLKEEPGSASVVLAVAQDLYGIGYSGIGFQNTHVRMVPLTEKDGGLFVEPTRESVSDWTYPLSRRLYLYVNKDPNEELPPIVLEFLKFANSEAGQATVAAAGVYPLTVTEAVSNLQVLTGSKGTPVAPAAESRAGVN